MLFSRAIFKTNVTILYFAFTISLLLFMYDFQLPGLFVEPLLFAIILYWIAGLRATFYAFLMTTCIAIAVMNVATACGRFLSGSMNEHDHMCSIF